MMNLQSKLETRIERLMTVRWDTFHSLLQQFWQFLDSDDQLKAILLDLERRGTATEAEGAARQIYENREALVFANEDESVAVSYFIIRHCVDQQDFHTEAQIGNQYDSGRDYASMVDFFRKQFLEAFCSFIIESLEDADSVLALLVRYKQKAEWFRRGDLFRLWETTPQRGEWVLGLKLYEYLHDNGIDFHLDPSSASGRVDLIGAQGADDPLLVEAKIFDADRRSKSYLVAAFGQLYAYTQDYNRPFGYMVIYRISAEDLSLRIETNNMVAPYVTYNNKTIFFVVIDIHQYQETASKRGQLRTIEIATNEFVASVEE